MKITSKVPAALVLLFGALQAFPVQAKTQEIQLRLETPIASYSHPGTPFVARVVGPVAPDQPIGLPLGTRIHGTVSEAHSIGWGIRRERARLALKFNSCELSTGEVIPCTVRLLSIDNARESVYGNNEVRGILAASHPHSWLNGLWYRPAPILLQRSAAGLTGATGMFYTKVAPCPLGAVAMLTARLALFRMPYPEIELPSGTDLFVRLDAQIEPTHRDTITDLTPVATGTPTAVEPQPLAPRLEDELRSFPADVSLADRTLAGDIVNFVFTGTRDQVIQSFEAAGWARAQPLTAKTFGRTYAAFAGMRTYPQAPVSPLYYQGRLPDLVFQRSFNSLAKRHHIRLWMMETGDGPVWLGAATHDVAIAFDLKRMSFTHRIDPQIDRERSKLANDLTAAGCATSFNTLDRPDMQRRLGNNGSLSTTDGALLVIGLRSCEGSLPAQRSLVRPRTNPVKLAVRRFILETRYYMTRGNAYYWTYRTVRWGFSGRGRVREDDE